MDVVHPHLVCSSSRIQAVQKDQNMTMWITKIIYAPGTHTSKSRINYYDPKFGPCEKCVRPLCCSKSADMVYYSIEMLFEPGGDQRTLPRFVYRAESDERSYQFIFEQNA